MKTGTIIKIIVDSQLVDHRLKNNLLKSSVVFFALNTHLYQHDTTKSSITVTNVSQNVIIDLILSHGKQ